MDVSRSPIVSNHFCFVSSKRRKSAVVTLFDSEMKMLHDLTSTFDDSIYHMQGLIINNFGSGRF